MKKSVGLSNDNYGRSLLSNRIFLHMRPKMNKAIIGGIVLLLIGMGLLGIGVNSFIASARKIFSCEKAEATVLEIKTRPSVSSKGFELSYPVVRFQAKNKNEYTFNGDRAYSGSPPFHEGDKVEVYYNLENPENTIINSFFEIWGLSAVLSGFGLAFLSGGILAIIKYR